LCEAEIESRHSHIPEILTKMTSREASLDHQNYRFRFDASVKTLLFGVLGEER
jgi:hypothetical protein